MNKQILSAGVVLVLFQLAPIAYAQPDPHNTIKAENPPNQVMGERRNGRNRTYLRNMTPEQSEQATTARRKQNIKFRLQQVGVVDAATQNAVVEFAGIQEKARQMVRDKAQKVSEALRTQVLSDAQIAGLLADLRATAEDEKTRSSVASQALDRRISFSKRPKLDALLTLMGLVGDEVALSNVGLNDTGGRGNTVSQRGLGGRGNDLGGFGGVPPTHH
jgi:hypothetical protein